MDPIFWLGLSILLVAISLAAVLLTMIPALKELARAAQGAEKLFDTLNRELPPTLEAIRLTSLELTELTDDLTDSIQSVGQVAQQLDSSVSTAKAQAKQVTVTSKSVAAGFKAAWQSLTTENATPENATPENTTAETPAKHPTPEDAAPASRINAAPTAAAMPPHPTAPIADSQELHQN
jgi:uncharacterized protein YoxC